MKKILLFLAIIISQMSIAQNVGIGTAIPVQKLHVEGATYLNGNVGIGNATPAFPLSFNQNIGDKISIWSNSTNSYGLGIQSSLMQIHTDVAAADIAFGYGSSSSFTETMRIKGNGALSINGNTGTAGQILQSNGSGTAPTWVNSATATVHYIGESYGGGIVFYVYENGQHGLIAATADQSTGIQWYNGSYTNTNAIRDGIGANSYNTEHIIANQGAGNYAAMECAKYNGGGYGDWYLPSKYELNLLYLQKTVVGGFGNFFYWSSSESVTNGVWAQRFSDGYQLEWTKNSPHYVRAVRAF